jgi:AcrR family transcriptional regulator
MINSLVDCCYIQWNNVPLNVTIFHHSEDVNPMPSTTSRRQKQAAATRQEIIAAARQLFATRGYAATSMSAIAKEAQTAVQTIYDSIGPKHAIILALVDTLETEADVNLFRQRIQSTTAPREAIALFVALTRNFAETGGDIITILSSAAASEPDIAAAWQKANANHRRGAGFVASIIERAGALRPDLSLEKAADTIGALTWGLTWQHLTGQYGWSLDECSAWMCDSLSRLLLRDNEAARGSAVTAE